MSSKFKDSILTFDCDEHGCHKNFECETGHFKDGWAAAREEGWIHTTRYERGVSRATHYCPQHASKYDGGPRG